MTSAFDNQTPSEKLRNREQLLRLIVENVRDSALIQVDTSAHVVYWNAGAERIFGYTRDEMIGCEYAHVFSAEDITAGVPAKDIERALAEGRAEYNLTLYKKDGTGFPAHWVTEPMWSDDRVLLGFVKVLTDKTEQNRVEEQLRKAQRMEALGRLAGGVAHDFNNLLTIIGGYASLLQAKLTDRKDVTQSLVQINEAVRRAARVTGQLLAFSRRQVTQPAILSVNELIAGMEKMLSPLLGEDIELILALDPTAGQVKVDPGQIEQIVVNLAANARDAMPSGGKLRIATGCRTVEEPLPGSDASFKPGQFAIVTVSDSGSGIPESARPHIFEPFFTTKPVDKGTGLGLATSYGIARQSGGALTVENLPGAGASFTLYLPRVVAEPRPNAVPESVASLPRGSGTILVVEDEAALRQLFVHSLSEAGYLVIQAPDGESALRVAAEYPGNLDLLVSDVVMPNLVGPDLARELKRTRPGLRVLFISGYTDETLTDRGILAPGTQLLQKPFRIAAFLEAVNAAIREREGRERTSAAG